MFDRLARGVIADSSQRDQIRKVVRLAALMHDCGHPAFSHLGEGILAALYSKSFDALSGALASQLKARVSAPGATQNPKHSKAAEVMSALILAAPATEQFANKLGITDDQVLDAISLVLGLPNTFTSELDNCLKVVDSVLAHAHSVIGHQRSTAFFEAEDAFQQDVFHFLNQPVNRQSNWRVESGRRQSHGILDISFDSSDGRGVVPVELKSEHHRFEKMVTDHAGQARQYSAAEGHSHFSVLYVECLFLLSQKSESEGRGFCESVLGMFGGFILAGEP